MIDHSNTRIVLVDTLYGGNLGSVARAMANFGLGKLSLVRPAEGIFDDPMLEPMAREGAQHILKNAKVFDNLQDALADTEVAMGFTNRLGKKRRDGYDIKPAVKKLSGEFPKARIAAVFGSEDKGLSNEDMEKCHWLVRIPTDPGLGSLNLSQAVCIFGYEVFHESGIKVVDTDSVERNTATVEEMESFYGHLEDVLDQIGFIKEENPSRMMNAMRRIFSRRLPDPRDVRILQGMLSRIETALDRAARGLDR